jgi:uncharacterized protein YndB with AHSA1/START domain
MDKQKATITVNTRIQAPVQKVWECWTSPGHIIHWNFASEEWHCPSAVNDLQPEGKFSWRMEAKDNSFGFDFSGQYREIKLQEYILWVLDDGREVSIQFVAHEGETLVTETFEPDGNDPGLQRQGWQAILDNFKAYVESR